MIGVSTHAQTVSPTPAPPCAGTPYPAYGDVDGPLRVEVLLGGDVPNDWTPPPCTGWKAGPTKVLMGAAGRFRHSGDITDIVARIVAVSQLTGVVYWSQTRQVWRRLFKDAAALSGPDPGSRRPDFSPAELRPGKNLHLRQEEDNLLRAVVYRYHIRERTGDRLIFESTNLTPLGFAIFDAVDAGEFRQFYKIERETGDVWRYFSLVRLGRASTLAATSASSYMNRAAAYYRYVAGIRMDREPPAAR